MDGPETRAERAEQRHETRAQQQGGARLLGSVRAARGGRAHQNGYIQMFETPNVTVRMSADHSVLNPTQTRAESESSESAVTTPKKDLRAATCHTCMQSDAGGGWRWRGGGARRTAS